MRIWQFMLLPLLLLIVAVFTTWAIDRWLDTVEDKPEELKLEFTEKEIADLREFEKELEHWDCEMFRERRERENR